MARAMEEEVSTRGRGGRIATVTTLRTNWTIFTVSLVVFLLAFCVHVAAPFPIIEGIVIFLIIFNYFFNYY